jgi:ribose/xylose/arabinose/galactoside ABC-type transport system permease subunit
MTTGTGSSHLTVTPPPPNSESTAVRRPWVAWLTNHSWLGPLAALVVLYGLFTALQPDTFATAGNLRTMVRQTTVVGMGALGMTLVIVLGGIDLSIGSMVAFVTVVIAWLLQAGWAPLPAALLGIAAGAACGLVNGLLITRLRVTPFIVTLGAMGIIRGAAKGLAHEQKIDAPITWLNDVVAELPRQFAWMVFPPGVWLLVLAAIAIGVLLNATRFGRHVIAIGSNEQAARLCGVRVSRVKVLVYTLAAALAGLAGVMQFSRLTVGDPTVAAGLELDVIAAVVIGGGSLAGGEGSILGSLVGAMLMTEIKTGCTHAGLAMWLQEIITGAIIVVAVALDRLRHSRRG